MRVSSARTPSPTKTSWSSSRPRGERGGILPATARRPRRPPPPAPSPRSRRFIARWAVGGGEPWQEHRSERRAALPTAHRCAGGGRRGIAQCHHAKVATGAAWLFDAPQAPPDQYRDRRCCGTGTGSARRGPRTGRERGRPVRITTSRRARRRIAETAPQPARSQCRHVELPCAVPVRAGDGLDRTAVY
jgi:hypothetical protein